MASKLHRLPVFYRCSDDTGTLLFVHDQTTSARGFWPQVAWVGLEWLPDGVDPVQPARAAAEREQPRHPYGKVARAVPSWAYWTVYRCYDSGALLYIGSTERSLSIRWGEHAKDRRGQRWIRRIDRIRIEHHPDKRTMKRVETRLIKAYESPFNDQDVPDRHPRGRR